MSTAALNSRRDFVADAESAPAAPVFGRAAAAPQPAPPISPPAIEAQAVEAPKFEPFRANSERRGPLRPKALVSTRSRLRGESVARMFRTADIVALTGLTWIACDLANPMGVWMSPVGAVAPFFAGVLALIFGLGSTRAYGFRPREGLLHHLMTVTGAFALTGAALAAIMWIAHAPDFLAEDLTVWFCLGLVLSYALHVGWWLAVRRLRLSGRLTPNVVIVGATKNAEKMVRGALERRDVAVLGIFDDRKGRGPDQVAGVPVLGEVHDMIGHRIMPYVDRVVITVTSTAQTRIRAIAAQLHALPNEVTLLMDVGDSGSASVMERMSDMPLAQLAGNRQDPDRAAAKRTQDLVIGVIALIIGAPIMALIALAVRLDSPGPIFFQQRRHGFNNEDIVVWKFRSMRHAPREDRGSRQVSYDDDRITAVGRIIRRTSLDELPQIWNVLKGEMSLVGPRPHSPTMKTGAVESSRLVAEYAHRHRMKPGMTGWAAIKGSRGPVDTPESVKRRVALDIEYIERQSFWLDLYIMLMTLPCLVGDRQVAR
jgi:Undecaprenyl-phosphate glucose phosphotransferase